MAKIWRVNPGYLSADDLYQKGIGLNSYTIANFDFFGLNTTIQTDTGELTLTGFEPTVTITDNVNVLTNTGVLILTGFAPTVQTPKNVVTQTGQLELSGNAPVVSVTRNVNINTETGQLILTGFAPLVVVTETFLSPLNWRPNPTQTMQSIRSRSVRQGAVRSKEIKRELYD